jgi:hypothetical protein
MAAFDPECIKTCLIDRKSAHLVILRAFAVSAPDPKRSGIFTGYTYRETALSSPFAPRLSKEDGHWLLLANCLGAGKVFPVALER